MPADVVVRLSSTMSSLISSEPAIDLSTSCMLVELVQLVPEASLLLSKAAELPLNQQIRSVLEKYGMNCNSVELQQKMRTTHLVDLLQHPFTAELFKDFMVKTHNEDVIICYLGLMHFREMDTGLQQGLMARVCYDRFVADGSELEANVPSTMKKQVKVRLDDGHIRHDMFDEIYKEVYKLMISNSWDGYRATPAFCLSLHVLKANEKEQEYLDKLKAKHNQEMDAI